jgi:putative acetyltransferase
MTSHVQVRPAGEGDLDALTDLWEASARSSHAFMDDEDFSSGRPYVRDLLLPSMDVWMALDGDEPVAFVGARDAHVELLYVAPGHQGQGLGRTLLAHVAGGHGPSSVQVYADNATGMAFYAAQGFRETRRHPTDGAGRPFAVAHLERT